MINSSDDPHQAAHRPVPELLMVKPPSGSAPDLDTALIIEAVFTMYRHWYEPSYDGRRPDSWARSTAEFWGTTFAAFLSSMPPTTSSPLSGPPSYRTAATAA